MARTPRTALRLRANRWWGAAAGWALAVVFATAWGVDLVPYSTVWGDAGSWATAICTLGGLIYAGLGLRHQVNQRNREEALRQEQAKELRWAHARQVSITSRMIPASDVPNSPGEPEETHNQAPLRVKYEVINTSPYPIDGVVVLSPLFEMDADSGQPHDEEIVQGTLFPGERVDGEGHATAGSDLPFAHMVDVCRVRFTDSWGTHWIRGPQMLDQCDSAALTC